MPEPRLILGIGELLWDIFPDSKRLGGAPANFAVMAGRLGNHATILSRIGRDVLGREAVDGLAPMPIEASALQVDPEHKTGTVTVGLEDGEPHYIIHEPSAWDFLDLTDNWLQLAQRADAVCFGTLAQRNLVARQTIQSLLAQCPSDCLRIFDVNLRAPYYSTEVLEESCELATVIKMNHAEVPIVMESLRLTRSASRSTSSLRPAAEALLSEFPSLELVAITRGSQGSLLVCRDEWHEHPGFPVKFADGVGAGDAFTAALAHYMLRGASLATLNEAGNRWGGWMASQSGAMPALPDSVRDAINREIEESA